VGGGGGGSGGGEEGEGDGEVAGVEGAFVEEALAGHGFRICGRARSAGWAGRLWVWVGGDLRSGLNSRTWMLQSASATRMKSCLSWGRKSAAMTSKLDLLLPKRVILHGSSCWGQLGGPNGNVVQEMIFVHTENPVNHTPFMASPIMAKPVPFRFLSTLT